MDHSLPKIYLGTAQWSTPYGINNSTGQPSLSTIKAIVHWAKKHQVTGFDTAPGYGEEILGKYLRAFPSRSFEVISKLPSAAWQEDHRQNLDQTIKKTLRRLHLSSIPIYLAYRLDELTRDNCFIFKQLKAYQQKGLINEIGVSVYTPTEARQALLFPEITVIQMPFSIADQKLVKSGLLSQIKKRKIKLFVRSIFLQGLLFKKNLPPFFKTFRPYQARLEATARQAGLSLDELALRYILSITGITGIIIGAETLSQVQRNMTIFNQGPLPPSLLKLIGQLPSLPLKMVDPRLWPGAIN